MSPEMIKGSTVFVVDDNASNLKVLIDLLADFHLTAVPLRSGEELLKLLTKRVPDLILLDILLKEGIDGFETCRRLKSNESFKEIPVVFLSALKDTPDKVKGFELGAVDYITKPIDGSELLSRVTTHLTLSRLRKELQTTNSRLEEKVLERTIELSITNRTLTARVNELNETRESLQKANEIKDQFLRNTSHELRTPLNGIMGMLSLLEYTTVSDTQKGYLKNISLSARNLLNLINMLLDFSQIGAGKLEVYEESFNLRQLVKDFLPQFIIRAKNKDIHLSYHIDESIDPFLVGDPLKIQQILVNLIDNALKFTKLGQIEIIINCLTRSPDQVLEFIVKDTGIGIEREHLPEIFESFRQIDGSYTRKYGGVGLGLPISTSLVGLMNGTLQVESEIGKGSSFSFQLQLNSSEIEGHPQKEEPLKKEKPTGGLHILVAEDEIINREYVCQMLKLKGYTLEKAKNGKIAFEMWQKGSFDLILMDIGMPVMNGIEAAVAIREQEKNTGKRVPIFALTAHTHEDDIKKYYEIGIDEYFSKPADEAILISSIERLKEG